MLFTSKFWHSGLSNMGGGQGGHIRQLSTAPMVILGNNNKQINWMWHNWNLPSLINYLLHHWSSLNDWQRLQDVRSYETNSISCCQNPNLTPTQRLGLTWKWLCKPHHHPTTTTQTQCQQYLRFYWPNFDETVNAGSWEHLEQIPTVVVTRWKKNEIIFMQ